MTAETCPHYLLLDDASPAGVLAKVNPPVRGRADVDAMWEGIEDGSIDTVGTDHVPRKRSTKAGKGIWASSNGFPGVATMASSLDAASITSLEPVLTSEPDCSIRPFTSLEA